MYLLEFSRHDCPGCDQKWFFDTIEEIEAFIKDAYPKFPVAEWSQNGKFYPDGLWIYEIVGRNLVLVIRSMYDSWLEDDKPELWEMPKWPLDQIIPRVDKEDLVKTVFHPDRMVKMGGVEWLESV
jgi:hypothetical protein